MIDQITKNKLIRDTHRDRWSNNAIKKLLKHYLSTEYNDESIVVREKLLIFPEDKELAEKINQLLISIRDDNNKMYNKYAEKIKDLITDDIKNLCIHKTLN